MTIKKLLRKLFRKKRTRTPKLTNYCAECGNDFPAYSLKQNVCANPRCKAIHRTTRRVLKKAEVATVGSVEEGTHV